MILRRDRNFHEDKICDAQQDLGGKVWKRSKKEKC